MRLLNTVIVIIGLLVVITVVSGGLETKPVVGEFQFGVVEKTDPDYMVLLDTQVASEVEDSCNFWYSKVDSMAITWEEKEWLKWIIFCESTCNSRVQNPYGFKGLVQFGDSTWAENCRGDIWSGFDQLECAVKLLRKGESSRWQCSK